MATTSTSSRSSLATNPSIDSRSCMPIAAFLACFAFCEACFAFNTFEHRAIGNAAFASATKSYTNTIHSSELEGAASILGIQPKQRVPVFDQATELLAIVPMEFGDLSALAGDFTENEGALGNLLMIIKEEVASLGHRSKGNLSGSDPLSQARLLIIDTRLQWLNACKWFHRISQRRNPNTPAENANCFSEANESNALAQPIHQYGSKGYHASREELALRERISNYVSLAANNKDHFPKYSWMVYNEKHTEALRLAKCSRRPTDGCEKATRLDLLSKAILLEGFAQHFLQDSFASGHIGTEAGGCLIETLKIWCAPTKERMQQSHDVLNEAGVYVRIRSPNKHVWESLDNPQVDQLTIGWTSFGDDHLYIPEAEFHRSVLLRVATASIREVLQMAFAFENESELKASDSCRTCSPGTFPVPTRIPDKARDLALDHSSSVADEKYAREPLSKFVYSRRLTDYVSTDPRIPTFPVEGWKFGVAIDHVRTRIESGATRRNTGLLYRLDYVRSTEPRYPNVFGFEVSNLPKRGSAYLVSAGWMFPPELANQQITLRIKAGWRTDENFTEINNDSQRRIGREWHFPCIEYTYVLYRPITIFAGVDFFLKATDQNVKDSLRKNYSAAVGIKFDFTGI